MTQGLSPPERSRFPVSLSDGHVRVLPAGLLLGRIHGTRGARPTAWDSFRFFGPTSSRFDHHPPTPRLHPRRGILYAAARLDDDRGRPVSVLRTCVAECFRERGVIELSRDAPYFVLYRLSRDVPVLDVADSDWAALAGGNAAISSGRRAVARDWSRAVYATYQEIEGIWYTTSTIPSARSVALYERAVDALPERPALHKPLSDPVFRAELEVYATELGLGLIP